MSQFEKGFEWQTMRFGFHWVIYSEGEWLLNKIDEIRAFPGCPCKGGLKAGRETSEGAIAVVHVMWAVSLVVEKSAEFVQPLGCFLLVELLALHRSEPFDQAREVRLHWHP